MYAGGGLIGERLESSSQPQARHLVDQPVAANSKLGPHPLDRPSLLERAGLQIASARTGAARWGTPPAEALAARAEALRARACLHAEAEAGRAAVRLAFPLVFCFLPAFVLLVVLPILAGALHTLSP